jgi:hypothetical protein
MDTKVRGDTSLLAEGMQSKATHESVVAVLKQDEQTTAYRYSDSAMNTVAADLRDDAVDLTVAGRSKQGEEDTLAVCRVLVERLRREREQWSDPIDLSDRGSRAERGVDCKATGPNDELLVQVTRAETGIWATLAQKGEVIDRGKPIEAATDQLRATIQQKAGQIAQRDRRKLVLALNAHDTPNLAFPAVVAAFWLRHGAWARGLGFRGVWLVGPSVTLTRRLDQPADL